MVSGDVWTGFLVDVLSVMLVSSGNKKLAISGG
jgi:hypothetical protein